MIKRANVFREIPAEDLVGLYVLVRAFPDEIDERSYKPVLYLLRTLPDGIGLSYRAVAHYLAMYSGRDCVDFLNDVQAIDDEFKPGDPEVQRVRELLVRFGYEEWARGEFRPTRHDEPARAW
jgi:hypothetical protein